MDWQLLCWEFFWWVVWGLWVQLKLVLMQITATLPDIRFRNVVILYFCSLQKGIRVAHQERTGNILVEDMKRCN